MNQHRIQLPLTIQLRVQLFDDDRDRRPFAPTSRLERERVMEVLRSAVDVAGLEIANPIWDGDLVTVEGWASANENAWGMATEYPDVTDRLKNVFGDAGPDTWMEGDITLWPQLEESPEIDFEFLSAEPAEQQRRCWSPVPVSFERKRWATQKERRKRIGAIAYYAAYPDEGMFVMIVRH